MGTNTSRGDAEIERERRAREALDAELNMVLYAVSHDLRAPIRSIDGFSQAVVEDFGDTLDDMGKDYLARVRRGCEALNAMIDDLLAMSRATRGEMRPVDVDVTAEARRIADALMAGEPERKGRVEVEEGLAARADRAMAVTVLEKLLENAWKFTSREEKAAVGLELDRETGEFVLRDNGAGMDMDYARRRLFAPFQRMHPEDDFPGRGMGLATAKRIINRHGGTLDLDCEPGKGCEVRFTFAVSD